MSCPLCLTDWASVVDRMAAHLWEHEGGPVLQTWDREAMVKWLEKEFGCGESAEGDKHR